MRRVIQRRAKANKVGKMNKTILIKQVGSPIRRPSDQRATLIGLGLNKMNKTRELKDTPEIRGMINKIKHLVEVIENKS